MKDEARADIATDTNAGTPKPDDVKVPLLLQEGIPVYKVSAKKKKMVTLRIDADEGCIFWESKKGGISASGTRNFQTPSNSSLQFRSNALRRSDQEQTPAITVNSFS